LSVPFTGDGEWNAWLDSGVTLAELIARAARR
jgi:hypothetical protein